MTIKQQGGVFGRNPTFNDVEIDGTLTIGGSLVPDPTNIAKLDAANVFTETQTVSGTKTIDSIWTGASSAGVGGAFRAIQNDGAALASGDRIGYLIYGGSYDGSGNIGFTASVDAFASQAWTSTARGTDVIISTTFNGTSSRSPRLYVRNDGTVEITRNLKVGSGYGIDFSATPGTGTSELFDDYEEGTWTPSLAFGTSVVLNSAAGTYTKMGRLVYVTFNIDVASHTQPDSSPISINGLPYNIAADIGTLFSIDPLASTFIDLTTTPLGGVKTSANTYLQLYQTDRSAITYTEAAASGKLVGAAMYEAS